MAFIYAADRKRIPLRLSKDDVAVAFTGPGADEVARKAARELRPGGAKRRAAVPPGVRVWRNVLLLRERGAAEAPVSTVVGAFSKARAARVRRTYPVYVDEDSGLRVVAAPRITVRFKPGASAAKRRALLKDLDLTPVGRPEFGARRVLLAPTTLASGSRVVDLANSLSEADDIVEYAAPDFLTEYRKFALPNDPLFPQQWHLHNDGSNGAVAGEDVRAVQAWQVSAGGNSRITIAIIDDGVDIRHPDLERNIWTNPVRSRPDRHGRSFTEDGDPNDPSPRVFNAPFDDTDTNDIHGTACAGVAAAVANNKKGVAGIGYRCRILPVKIFAGEDLAPHARIADAIRYAGQHADVISCSWGIAPSPDVEAAIDEVTRSGRRGKGSLVFCATGNEYSPRIAFPAKHSRALAVGASSDRGLRSKYSNWGKGIAFVAPSSDEDRDRQSIVTTDVSTANRGYSGTAYADDFGGTSSATPLAAGIGALVLAVNPKLTWQKAVNILKASTDVISAKKGKYKKGYSLQFGHGRLNAYKAVTAARSSR